MQRRSSDHADISLNKFDAASAAVVDVTPAALNFEVLDVLLGTKGKTMKYPLIQLQCAISC
jgi:hypothetical protein